VKESPPVAGSADARRRGDTGGWTVKITIRLFGVFRIGRFKEEVRDYPPGTTARAVVEQLRLPTPLLGTTLIGGVHAHLDDLLTEGDELTILPILEGG